MIDRPLPPRLRPVALLCLVPFLFLVPRLAWLQLVKSDHLDNQAWRQSMSRVRLSPHRGAILDRHGNRLAYSVSDTLRGHGEPMRRLYPYGAAASHVVGHLNDENVGAAGIEMELEPELRGHPGWETRFKDGMGKTRKTEGPGRPVTTGYTAQLTLDAGLQDVAMSRLAAQAVRLQAKSASAVAVDPHTGEVLLMASWPTFDPENLRRTPLDHFRNRAISDPIEPGSTFKIVTAVTALQQRLFGPNTSIHCENGSHTFHGRTIHDHTRLGLLPFHSCFAKSSNVAFAKVGEACGASLYDTARSFGFGSATGIRLPGEANGVLRDPSQWSRLTPASLAIGYEVMATPLQMAMAYAAVANGGILLRPYVLKSLVDAEGEAKFVNRPEPVARILEPDLARRMRAFMAETVEDGTGKEAALPWVQVGGKTGTSRKLIDGVYSPSNHYASFVGMAPLDDPRIVLYVLFDDPKGRIYGGTAAAPVFREILDAYRRIPGALLAPSYETLTYHEEPGRRLLDPLIPREAEAHDEVPEPGTAGTMGGLPDMRGMAVRLAMQTCETEGVRPEVVGTGVVVRQVPGPGAERPGTVRLVCRPPEPAVWGQSPADPAAIPGS